MKWRELVSAMVDAAVWGLLIGTFGVVIAMEIMAFFSRMRL